MILKRKYTKIIICFILFIIFLLVNTESIVADDHDSPALNVTQINDFMVVEYDKSIIQKGKDFIVPSQTSVRIKNKQYTITPPKGTDIIDYDNSSVDVVFENFELKTINISDSESYFIPLNFIASVQDLNNFSLRVDYNSHFSSNALEPYVSSYTIDWGDGKKSTGEGTLPDTMNHSYQKTGQYKITVNITDENNITYSYLRNQGYKLSSAQIVTFWTIDNKDPIIIGSTSMMSCFFIIGMAYSETSRYKLFALLTLAFPMTIYANKEDVLDQFVRGQIFGYIKTNPGADYNQLMRELDIKNGTLSYHLYILEKTGLIKSRTEGYRYRVFYPTDMKFPEEERNRLTELQIKILNLIKEHDGTSQKQLTKLLDEKHQTISYNIKVLREAGLIRVNKKGRKSLCYIIPDHAAYQHPSSS